jgi:Gpi18-like mannosyltransferase
MKLAFRKIVGSLFQEPGPEVSPRKAALRRWSDVALLTLVALTVRFRFLPHPGHVLDIQTFGQWALAAADAPWNRAYEATDMNYPPGAMLVFELMGRIYRALVTYDPGHGMLRVAVKLPNILFDLIGGIVIYGIARRWVEHRLALLAMAIFAFNPAIIYDSSIWGMNDSITAVSALSAIWCMLCRKRTSAWVLLAFAVLNKPPVLVLAPLFALETFATSERKEWGQHAIDLGLDVLTMLGVGWLIALPFYTAHSFYDVYHRMIEWYVIGSSLYPFTSANAFNVHALYGDFFKPDTDLWLWVPIKVWANGAFILTASLIYWRYSRLRDERALLESAFLLMLAFFLILTEMHERYLVYAVMFIPPLAVLDRTFLWSACLLTITQWLNLEYSMTYLWINAYNPPGINPKEFAPALARLCALTNIGVFIATAREYLLRGSSSSHVGGRPLGCAEQSAAGHGD